MGCWRSASSRCRWRASPVWRILSQGDEVVPPEQEPGPGQVRDINSYTLARPRAAGRRDPLTYPIVPDRQEALDAAARNGV